MVVLILNVIRRRLRTMMRLIIVIIEGMVFFMAIQSIEIIYLIFVEVDILIVVACAD